MDRSSSTNGRTITTEWSFPRLNLPQSTDKKRRDWGQWITIVFGVISIVCSIFLGYD